MEKSVEDILRSNWFLKTNSEGIYIDFRSPPTDAGEQRPNTLLFTLFSGLFENGYYIQGLSENTQLLSFIFDKKIPNTFAMKIGRAIKEVSEIDFIYQPTITIVEDARFAVAEFVRIKKESGVSQKWLSSDIVIALAWRSSVKYGLIPEAIQKGVAYANQELSLESGKIQIAKQKDAELPKDAELVVVTEKLKIDRRADVSGDDAEIEDMYRFKNTIFQVKKGEVIYKKLPPKEGKPGRDVLGKSIFPSAPRDEISLEEYAGEGTCITLVEGCESLVVDVDGTISLDGKKVVVKEGITLKTVDSTTGNLKVRQASERMVIEEDIHDYRKIDAEVKELIIKGKIYGSSIEVIGDTSVEVLGGVVKGKIIHRGHGKIKLSNKVITSVIYSKEGETIIDSIENSTVISQSANIDTLQNGTLIGGAINVNNVSNTEKGKTYIMGEDVYIDTISGGGELGITCFWCEDEKKEFLSTFKSKESEELGRNIENLKQELAQKMKENKEGLKKYVLVQKEMNDPECSDEKKGKLFLEKKRLFSKVLQPIEKLKLEISDLQEKYDALNKNIKVLDDRLTRFKIHISHNGFEGDMFTHHYKYPKVYNSITDLSNTLLLEVCQTKAIPSDMRREYFNKLYPPRGGSFKWNAYDYMQKVDEGL